MDLAKQLMSYFNAFSGFQLFGYIKQRMSLRSELVSPRMDACDLAKQRIFSILCSCDMAKQRVFSISVTVARYFTLLCQKNRKLKWEVVKTADQRIWDGNILAKPRKSRHVVLPKLKAEILTDYKEWLNISKKLKTWKRSKYDIRCRARCYVTAINNEDTTKIQFKWEV